MQYIMKPFEDLTNRELYHILKLREEVFIIEQCCIYPDIDDKDEAAYHLLALEEADLVGYLRILGRGVRFDEIAISRVVVPERLRGRGIAKKMMLEALDFIRDVLKETRIRISAQSAVIPFYQGLGFEVSGGEYLEDDIPHVNMVCDLSRHA